MRRFIGLLALVLFTGGVLGACGRANETAQEPTTQEQQVQPPVDTLQQVPGDTVQQDTIQ